MKNSITHYQQLLRENEAQYLKDKHELLQSHRLLTNRVRLLRNRINRLLGMLLLSASAIVSVVIALLVVLFW